MLRLFQREKKVNSYAVILPLVTKLRDEIAEITKKAELLRPVGRISKPSVDALWNMRQQCQDKMSQIAGLTAAAKAIDEAQQKL